MRSAASRRNARPPIPVPGAAGRSPRPTVRRRHLIAPRLLIVEDGYPVRHPYVRRFWTAALGPESVAALMRLARAAEKSQSILRPTPIPTLARAGLVAERGRELWVRSTVPPLPASLLRRLPQALQREALSRRPTTNDQRPTLSRRRPVPDR